ncbi:MAG: tyrosine-type recombinase/integrase [Bacteroidales bacterium]|nr:tyrosine-type recombinase/integrase [Bacteroidales bacterium]
MKPSEYYQLKEKHFFILSEFEGFLQKQGYAKGTIEAYKNYTADFLNWLEGLRINKEQVNYNDLLNFIKAKQIGNNSIKLINRKLGAVRKYYEYLQLDKNPASGLYLKTGKQTLPINLLTKEELEEIYENYHIIDLRTARNKTILNLLINQALTTEELHRLEPRHIKLKPGKIEIPGSKHSNSRILKLESSQILELQDYLQNTRIKILQQNKLQTSQLLISMSGSLNLKNSLYHLFVALKKINPKVNHAMQVRQSVIAEWLKTKDLRMVQYMAGHKYVSTTERYQVNNLEDLEEALNKYHPLK